MYFSGIISREEFDNGIIHLVNLIRGIPVFLFPHTFPLKHIHEIADTPSFQMGHRFGNHRDNPRRFGM